MKKLYQTLGVAPGADQDTIKKTYRKLARELHPDLHPDDAQATERFKEVSAAYEVLSDPSRRALYDEFGEDALRQGFDPDLARAAKQWQRQPQSGAGFRPSAGFGFGTGAGPGAGFSDIPEDLLRELFGGGAGRAQGPARGTDLKAELTLDFMTAALGGERLLRLGDGSSKKVRIPAGVEDGGTLRLRGQGGAGPGQAPSGDLLLTIHVQPHELFRRKGLELHLDLPITVVEAIQGAQVTVPTLEGAVELQIPAGAQPGQTLRLRGQGIKRGKKPPADMFVHLQVRLPPKQDLEPLKEALAALERAYTTHPRKDWGSVNQAA